jgi:putative oxidoreductase
VTDQTDYLKAHLSFECPEAYLMPMIVVAAIVQIVGSILLIMNNRTGAWILLAFVSVVSVLMHNFWDYSGPEVVVEMVHFLKNVSIAGGLLVTLSNAPKYKRD